MTPHENEDHVEGHQHSKKQMGVDSFPRMSEHGAKDGLKVDQSGGDGAEPAQPPAVDAPVCRSGSRFHSAEVKIARLTVKAKNAWANAA